MCVRARIHMYMMGLCVDVWEVRRGRAGIGAGLGGVRCLPCLPSAVTVWCDVRSQSVLTPRIILKTHTSSPPAKLLSHAEPAQQCVSAETVSWLIQSLKNLNIISWLFYVKHSPRLWEFPTSDILYHSKWIICSVDETSNPIAKMLRLNVSLNFTFMLWPRGA